MKWWLVYLVVFGITLDSHATDCSPDSILNAITPPDKNAVELETISSRLRHMDKTLIKEAQAGTHFSYWVDDLDQIHFSDIGHLPKNENNFIVLSDIKTKNGFIIKDSGEFYYDPSKKGFTYDSKNSWDLLPGEIDAAIAKQSDHHFTRTSKPELQQARVMKCTDTLADQLNGNNFVKDGILASAVVTSAMFVSTNPDLLDFSNPNQIKKAKLLAADLLGNIGSSYVSGKLVKPLLAKDVGIFRDFFQRSGTDFATNALIKRPIYNAVIHTEDNKPSMGSKMLPFDTGFSVIRFFPKRVAQRFTVNTLPNLLLASCLKNSAATFILSPKMVRIADQGIWGYIYMSSRNKYLDSPKKEEDKK